MNLEYLKSCYVTKNAPLWKKVNIRNICKQIHTFLK